MATYGRQVLATTGIPVMALADLERADWKPGGITIDWSLVTAVSGDTTLGDGTVIKNGKKGIEYGTILCQKDVQEQQTVTLSNATGGTFTLTGNGNTTAALAYNAAASTVQSAIRGLGGVYSQVLVTGSAGGPYTVTFPAGSGDVAALTYTDSTTGSGHAIAIATATAGSATGTYGPYDSGATDGRQNLTRGFCYILNETVLEEFAQGIGGATSDNPAVFEGGLVWKARLKVGGTNPSYLGSGSQPSWSAFETAFPRIRYAQ